MAMSALVGVKINAIDLNFAKEYLKVDYTDEDNLITALIVAAQSYVETMLGFPVQAYIDHSEVIPDELTVAALLLISHWYNTREMQQYGSMSAEIEFAVSAILDAHKDHMKLYSELDDTGADTTHFN